MKKLILFLFLSTSLFCFGQGKSALKDIQSIKFYGVDYSQVKIFGADESPAQFKDAFRRINELFITEAKKYNVGKQLKKEVTEISLDAVNQVNENIDLTELMTAKREYTLSKEQIKAAINALPIQKTPGVGMVFIAQFLDKSNNNAGSSGCRRWRRSHPGRGSPWGAAAMPAADGSQRRSFSHLGRCSARCMRPAP